MAHDILNHSAESESGRASLYIVGILLGGVLLMCSYITPLLPIFARATTSGTAASIPHPSV